MRNFSHISTSAFCTYSINTEYYKMPVDIIEDVLKALAKGLEVRLDVVRDEFLSGSEPNHVTRLTSSEQRAVSELRQFYVLVTMKDDCEIQNSCDTYTYVNMNTGVAVVWTHLVD